MRKDPILVRENEFYTKVIKINGKVISNQNGIFPVTSRRGYKEITIMYDHESNAILAETLNSKG